MAGVETRKRGRPRRIEQGDIVRAALEIGLDRLTMRAVAARLGVGLSSLYYHVDGVEELTKLASSAMMADFDLPPLSPDNWEHAARHAATALRDLFESTPGMLGHGFGDPRWGWVITQLNETACKNFVRAGFDPATAWLAVRSIADFVEAYTVRKRTHQRVGRTDLEQAALECDRQDAPTLHAAFEKLGASSLEQRFDFGLDCLLRGLRCLREDAAHR